MKQFVVVLLLLSISLTYANDIEEDQPLVLDEEEENSQELLALIEDGKLSIEDIVGEEFISNALNDIVKDGDVQDRSWKKCFRINKSFKIVFKRFRFSVSGCLEVIWLSSDMGVRIILTVGRLRISRTISLRNPPSICYGIPGFKLAKVCLQFYDINIGRRSGCARLNFRFLRWGWNMRLGCFRRYHVMADDEPSSLSNEKFKTIEEIEDNTQETDMFKYIK
ncbi:hypothetical protein ACJMK2_024855 [Sinanodonta woodiana]|uniref:DUF4773 domain-containing protein n=1 Tax=Sinanodonta woodiana TaxID=1069815 RepID=A0ABD3XGK0_SINWO